MDKSGQGAATPTAMPAAAWKEVVLRAWRESSKDNIGLVSAGVAFYAFLALAPLLAAIVLAYGVFADPHIVVDHMRSLMTVMPADAAKLIGDLLLTAVQGSDGKKGVAVLVALAIALFGARNGAGSILTALNIAYEEEEKRSWIGVNLTALAITAGAVAGAIAVMAAMSVMALLEDLLPHMPGFVIILGKIVAFALLAVMATAGMATLYRYAPSRDKPKWSWALPGSLFAALLALALTAGFGVYVANFGNYDATYGSLGTVMVLLTWMYLTTYVFLFGAELNAEAEHQTARDTTAGAARPLGARGAWAADNVAGMVGQEGRVDGEMSDEDAPAADATGSDPHPPRPEDQKPGSPVRVYLAGRASSWLQHKIGLKSVGMISSALVTLGLGMVRKKGKALQGLAILGAASGLAFLGRPRDEIKPPAP